jgi:perosamine synthetase
MIPVCEPYLCGNELKYVTDCLKSNWIGSMGKYISLFEESFANFCDTKYGVGCSNGTTALHLALASLGIGPGDEVIIPDFTMIATANAVIYTGAKPVLIDSELETWNINVAKIEEKMTKKTKVIIPVHTYGHPVDMDTIKELANKYNLFVIEDAAEAHGAEYQGKKIGSLSDIACFSFYSNKIITCGEGGMLVTNNEKFADKAKLLRNHAFTKPRFLHHELGFNYRMTNIQAAIGLAQTENADKLVNARINNAKIYNNLLKDVPGIRLPPKKDWAKNVYWMYGILINDEFGIGTQNLREELFKKGIDTRSFFVGMHNQPLFKDEKKDNYPTLSGDFSNSEYLEKRGLYLPSSSALTESQINKIVAVIKSIQEKCQ